jgi:putative membrane protein
MALRAFIQVLLNAVGLVVTEAIVPGVSYDGDVLGLLVAGLVIGLINLVVRPVVKLLSLPFIVLTLGLFYLVINGALFALAAALLPWLQVDGCLPAIAGGLVMALFNWVTRALMERGSGERWRPARR